MSLRDFKGSDGHASEDEERDFQMDKAKKQAKKSRTPTLDHFGDDLTKKALEGKFDPVVGREEEINQMIEVLNKRKKNNPLLVGDPGVGKTAIVEGLAQRIADMEGIDNSFHGVRLIELNLTSLVSGTKYRGMFEERMDAIVREASEDDKVILFIDELHTVIGAGNTSGAMDASNILKPALARGEMKVVGATTLDEYHKHIEKDKAFDRRFQRVMVDLPSKEESIEILNNVKSKYEDHHCVSYTDEMIEKIYDLSERYVPSRNNPDKSIDLMDEVGSKIKIRNSPKPPESINELRNELKEIEETTLPNAVAAQDFEEAALIKEKRESLKKDIAQAEIDWKEQVKLMTHPVTIEDIAQVISSHTGIPVSSMTEDELGRLAEMANTLKSKLISQDDAVDKVSDAVQRSRTGVRDPKRPIASFLFLGPTGVGKCITKDSLIKVRNKSTGEMSEVSVKDFRGMS